MKLNVSRKIVLAMASHAPKQWLMTPLNMPVSLSKGHSPRAGDFGTAGLRIARSIFGNQSSHDLQHFFVVPVHLDGLPDFGHFALLIDHVC